MIWSVISYGAIRGERLDAVEQSSPEFRRQQNVAAQSGIEIGIGHLDQLLQLSQFIVGKLGAVDKGVLTLEDGAKSYPVPLEDVVSARLVFEFGPAPKPVNNGSKKKKRKT